MKLVRLHEAPFTDRLVAKFGLSVVGWRGSAERRLRSGSDGADGTDVSTEAHAALNPTEGSGV